MMLMINVAIVIKYQVWAGWLLIVKYYRIFERWKNRDKPVKYAD